jgi:streptomycin 6-kinase
MEQRGRAYDLSVKVLQFASGRGCVEMLAHSAPHSALLLERLGPNVHALGLSIPTVLETIVTTLKTFWRPVPTQVELPTGTEKAEWLSQYVVSVWGELERPFEQAIVDRVSQYCERRIAAFDPSAAVLVHGDAHGWNTLRAATKDSFKFVDLEGLLSEPAHDLAVPMREYNEPLLAGDTAQLARERAEWLGRAAGVDSRCGVGVGIHRAGIDRSHHPPFIRQRQRSALHRSGSSLSQCVTSLRNAQLQKRARLRNG